MVGSQSGVILRQQGMAAWLARTEPIATWEAMEGSPRMGGAVQAAALENAPDILLVYVEMMRAIQQEAT
jgi:hypothetical protein